MDTKWLAENKEFLKNFPETNSFFTKPLFKITGINAPFTTSGDIKYTYDSMLKIIDEKIISPYNKMLASICFALAVSEYVIKHRNVTFELEQNSIDNHVYYYPILLYKNIPNHVRSIDPINLTLKCLNSKGKIGFDFYCWHMVGVLPNNL